MSGGRPYGFVKNPIICPGHRDGGCSVVTAVPFQGRMWLTEAAAGFYPHGYRCHVHKFNMPDVDPQPSDAPPRLTKAGAELVASLEAAPAPAPVPEPVVPLLTPEVVIGLVEVIKAGRRAS